MAKNTIADLDVTTGNNTDVLGQNSQGSADANQLDAVDRATLALLARFYADLGGVVTVGGSANAITVTSASTYQALATGLVIAFKAGSAPTSSVTLNLDSLGAKAIRLSGDVALAGGEMKANGRYLVMYDAAYNSSAGAWVLMNPEVSNLFDVGAAAFSGLIYGLTLSNNGSDATNDIDIAAGTAIDGTNAKFMKLASGITKRLDASWAVGTGNGGLDTGTIADTTYHVWLIMRSDTGVVDALFSTSASSPTMPSNYDYKRRIGSIVRSSSAIRAFKQVGEMFNWDVQVSDVFTLNPGTSAVTSTLTVPTGIVVNAVIMASLADASPASATNMLVTPLSITDTTPSTTARTISISTSGASVPTAVQTVMDVITNTSGQIRYRLDGSDTDRSVRIHTIGWKDTRGRLA